MFVSRDYQDAFLSIENQMTPKQREILEMHFNAPRQTITTTELAEGVGFPNHSAVNLQYGKLAHMLGEALGMRRPPEVVWLSVLTTFEKKGEKRYWHFTLRKEVVQALKKLGWF